MHLHDLVNPALSGHLSHLANRDSRRRVANSRHAMMHDEGLFSKDQLTLIGSLLLVSSTSTLLWYAYVVVAVCRLMRSHPSFILIGSHAIADLWTMMQYVWLSLDIIVDNKLAASYPMATMLYNFGWYPGLLHFTVVAFNRAHIVLDPVKHSKFWTHRVSMGFVLISWILGFVLAVVFSYAFPAKSHSYYIYVPVNFGRRPGNSFEERLLLFVELGINVATLLPSLVAYFVSFAYSIQLSCRQRFVDRVTLFTKKTPSQKGVLKWSVQQRLWIICIFNLVPSALHFFFLTFETGNVADGTLSLFRAFFGLFATMIPSILLPLFSTLVRKKLLFFPQKTATTTVSPFTVTENSTRVRGAYVTR
uniref:7TM_GPCR_Srx domain-containing protein n=1 Tax=Steinernema glaseri TaxID=37863 RepID=A0A1I7YW05_9BILA